MASIDKNLALVPPEKIRDYLLSPTHPIGRYKSVFFQMLGYRQEEWRQLAGDLHLLLDQQVQALELTEFGQKWAARGQMTGPNGRSGAVVSIWITLHGETIPRFVTAYPEE